MSDVARILVVDDDEVVRRSYVRALSGTDRSVETASNGADALAKMDQQAFDVVLLDLRMPGMNGMAVLESIRQNWPHSEVVVITGYPALETAKKSVRLGAFDYLAKPVGPDEVIHAAQGALSKKRWALRSDRRAGYPRDAWRWPRPQGIESGTATLRPPAEEGEHHERASQSPRRR